MRVPEHPTLIRRMLHGWLVTLGGKAVLAVSPAETTRHCWPGTHLPLQDGGP